ncbi:MAG: hypothetical protein CL555_06015 [Algoriphagus sp.]|nr:hypothetical protein [Algoriphagus sp.]
MRNQEFVDDVEWRLRVERINRMTDAYRAETRKMIERAGGFPKRTDYPNRQQYRAAVSQHRKARP